MNQITGFTLRERLQENENFSLHRDYSLKMDLLHSELFISRKIYGRDFELNKIDYLLEEAVKGQKEVLFITGDPGTGKTFLVKKLNQSLKKHKGFFLSGKCEKRKRNIPYYSFIQAINHLSRKLMTESPIQGEFWKRKIQEVVGLNGQIIVDLFPELEKLIGKQPSVSILPANEAKNRFNLVIKDFLRLFSQVDVPLVIFIDDLQWVDQATLNLMNQLFEDDDINKILFIGAYREEETNGSVQKLEEKFSLDYKFNKLKLGNLDKQAIQELFQDTLQVKNDKINDLVDYIYNKTKGNPFFTNQYLQAIYEENLLKFDVKSKKWHWDLTKIRKINISDSITDLMSNKIEKLPSQSQTVLKLAACLGHVFDLDRLSKIYGKTKKETFIDLTPALIKGLIKIKGNLSSDIQGYIMELDESKLEFLNITYLFKHEDINEAAYLMIPVEAKKGIHLIIGKVLLESTSEAEVYDRVYEILNHWNKALGMVSNLEDKIQWARLNLLAGKKAKAASANDSALTYLKAGIKLLSQNSWQTDYHLTFNLYLEMAECEYLNVNYQEAENLFEEILKFVQRDLDKVQVYVLKMTLYTNLGKVNETIEIGIEALKLFNVPLKVKPNFRRLISKFIKVQYYWNRNKSKDFAESPVMTSPEKMAVMGVLMALTPVAYLKSQLFFMAIVLEIIYNTLKYGNNYVAAYGWGIAGLVIGSGFGNYTAGYKLGKLSLVLTEEFNRSEIKSKNQFTFGWFISHWRVHAKEGIKHLKQGVQDGLTNGDTLYAAYCGSSSIVVMNSMGLNLDKLFEEAQNSYHLVKQLKNEYTAQPTVIIMQMVLALKGKTSNNLSLSDDSFDEDLFRGEINEESIKALYYIIKMQLAYLFGHYQNALENDEKCKKHLAGAMGTIYTTDYYLYRSLILLALFTKMDKWARVKIKFEVKKNIKKLKKWAKNCPENYLHKYLMVDAEMARIEGKVQRSLELNRLAVNNAEANGYIHLAALGYELAAKHLLTLKDLNSSKEYLYKANQAYLNWGALAKSQELIKEFGILFEKN